MPFPKKYREYHTRLLLPTHLRKKPRQTEGGWNLGAHQKAQAPQKRREADAGIAAPKSLVAVTRLTGVKLQAAGAQEGASEGWFTC